MFAVIFVPTIAAVVAAVVIARRSQRPVLWGRVAAVLAGEHLAGAWIGLWPLQPWAGPVGPTWRWVMTMLGG